MGSSPQPGHLDLTQARRNKKLDFLKNRVIFGALKVTFSLWRKLMESRKVSAKLKYYRMSPVRMREVADLVRGKSAEEAQNILEFTVRKAATPLKKLLDSAIANAENNFGMDLDSLYVDSICVDEGPRWKRFMPRAQGRASRIIKRTSHVTIELSEIKK